MKKYLLLLALLGLSGCHKIEPTVAPPVQSVPAKPEIPKEQPAPPVTPSVRYLKGYEDGFYGTWLAPGRWLTDEYRNGWSAGSWDRTHNQPHRYKKST